MRSLWGVAKQSTRWEMLVQGGPTNKLPSFRLLQVPEDITPESGAIVKWKFPDAVLVLKRR